MVFVTIACFAMAGVLQFLTYRMTGNGINLVICVIDGILTVILPGGIIELFTDEYTERITDGTV